MIRLSVLLGLFPGLSLCTVSAEHAVLLSYQAAADAEPSANPDSDFWRNIKGVSIEHTILGASVTNLQAEVRSRWTANHLYLLFVGNFEALNLKPDPDTTSETYRLWQWDCFEAYLGSDFSQTNRYREFQMSPQGEFLDLDIDASKPRPGYNDERLWNSGMKVKARVDDGRKVWCGEMRIPMEAIDSRKPQAGNELLANFCRQDGKRPRSFLAWQPTGVWNPHRPEKFGRVRLAGGASR